MTIVSPVTPEDFEKYHQLRYEVLRQPWRQPRGSERAPDDDTATHAMLLNEAQQVVGVCRLHRASAPEAQIRFMAIRADQQGQGLGHQLLTYLENIARQWGTQEITLQARENAVNFYRRNGYVVVEKTHLLFGEIQHYRMVKRL